MRVLREGGVGNFILAGLAVAAAAAIWSAVVANDKVDEERKMREFAELQRSGLIVELASTRVELKNLIENPKTKTIYKTIVDKIPGETKTEIVEVIKWKTKTVTTEVPVEILKTVFHCDAEEPVEIVGDITGEILKVKTDHGNIIVNGYAECWINDGLMFDSEFDWDATEAWALSDAQRRDPVKRWLLGVEWAMITDDTTLTPSCDFRDRSPRNYRSLHGYDNYSCQSSPATFSVEDFRVDFSRIWFPRKKWSIGTGVFVQADAIGPRLSVLF